MDYIKVRVYTSAEACELLADELAPVTGGCQVNDPAAWDELFLEKKLRWDYIDKDALEDRDGSAWVEFFIPADAEGERILRAAGEKINEIKQGDAAGFYGELRIEVSDVQSRDWENNWKQYYKPFEVGETLLIAPSWEQAEPGAGRKLVTIDPSSSFGTGLHATTRMCMEKISAMELAGTPMLDMGCGSGILACCAMALGAANAVTCDIERNAAAAVQENMRRNSVPENRYTIVTGDVLSEPSVRGEISAYAPFGLICANIVADVLIAMSDMLLGWLRADGVLLLSGIIDFREGDVAAAFERAGVRIADRRTRDNWVMLEVKKVE